MDNQKISTYPTLNFSEIPSHVRDDIAAATLAAVRECMSTPEGKAMIEKRIATKKQSAMTEKRKVQGYEKCS